MRIRKALLEHPAFQSELIRPLTVLDASGISPKPPGEEAPSPGAWSGGGAWSGARTGDGHGAGVFLAGNARNGPVRANPGRFAVIFLAGRGETDDDTGPDSLGWDESPAPSGRPGRRKAGEALEGGPDAASRFAIGSPTGALGSSRPSTSKAT